MDNYIKPIIQSVEAEQVHMIARLYCPTHTDQELQFVERVIYYGGPAENNGYKHKCPVCDGISLAAHKYPYNYIELVEKQNQRHES